MHVKQLENSVQSYTAKLEAIRIQENGETTPTTQDQTPSSAVSVATPTVSVSAPAPTATPVQTVPQPHRRRCRLLFRIQCLSQQQQSLLSLLSWCLRSESPFPACQFHFQVTGG